MLKAYRRNQDRLSATEVSMADAGPTTLALWYDLLSPSPEEDRLVSKAVGVDIPTREEMQEIEVSARLYQENGAEFLTITAVAQLDTSDPVTTPITFVVIGSSLITVRYAEPKAFTNFTMRAQKAGSVSCSNGEQIMLGLIEALLDRMADALERVGVDVDKLSREVFRRKAGTKRQANSTEQLQSIIEKIGQDGDLLTMIRESLVSINRALAYHTSIEQQDKRITKEAKGRVKILYRDVVALTDQTAFLSNKINFLLDATLGLINLQQNQIIKIFSVVSVVFLPPTLVASAYGMNFKNIPELSWDYGYPWAIILMFASAALPYIYFQRRGWL